MKGADDGGRESLTADAGSFRDPSGRVYVFKDSAGEQRVVRGLTAASAANVERLLAEPFFQQMRDDGDVAHTRFASPDDEVAAAVMDDGWASAVEHVPVEFLTWPYEWPFSMLQDAALLQLRLLETAVESGWILKDATPFNIQWVGTRPVFVDIPSFVPRQDGEYWQGYRQFCSLFLIPLMLTAHLRIPYQPLLRSNLEGIPPEEAAKYFRGLRPAQERCSVPRLVSDEDGVLGAAARSGGRIGRLGAPAIHDRRPGVAGCPGPPSESPVLLPSKPIGVVVLFADALVRSGRRRAEDGVRRGAHLGAAPAPAMGSRCQHRCVFAHRGPPRGHGGRGGRRPRSRGRPLPRDEREQPAEHHPARHGSGEPVARPGLGGPGARAVRSQAPPRHGALSPLSSTTCGCPRTSRCRMSWRGYGA